MKQEENIKRLKNAFLLFSFLFVLLFFSGKSFGNSAEKTKAEIKSDLSLKHHKAVITEYNFLLTKQAPTHLRTKLFNRSTLALEQTGYKKFLTKINLLHKTYQLIQPGETLRFYYHFFTLKGDGFYILN